MIKKRLILRCPIMFVGTPPPKRKATLIGCFFFFVNDGPSLLLASNRVGRNGGCPDCAKLKTIASHYKKVINVTTN